MQRIFEDGDIIFSEGDAGDTAFVIKSGTVSLDKAGSRGPVHIADLGRGELLGEMGALDGSPRSATARAKGKTELHTIPRGEFLGLVTKDPDMAMRVMTKLVERLRAADERLAKYEASQLPARTVGEPPAKATKAARTEAEGEPKKGTKSVAKTAAKKTPDATKKGEDKETDGLLAKIFGLGRKKPDGDRKKATDKSKPGKKAPPKPAKPLSVAVHPIAGDENGALRKLIVGGLEKIGGVTITPLKKPLSSAPEPDFNSLMATQVREGQAWLTKNEVDLMIVGGLEPTGRLLELRFVPADSEPGDRSAAAPVYTPFYIPPSEGEVPIAPLWQELCAAAVAATLPARSRAQMGAILQITQGVGAGLSGLKDLEMPELSPQERAAVTLHGANILAASANLSGNPADLDTAIDLNRFSLRLLQSGDSPLWIDAQRQLALALLALSERNEDVELLEWAADALRAALSRIPRDRMPWTWGRLQNRLGQALYRLDLEKMSEAALKESVNAFQMALQVLDKAKDAVTWSETMNNLSQSLQLYGEQTGNQTVIARAVDSAKAALDNCAVEDTPFLWAAIQNNLGAAYFLWSKNGGGRDKLEAAEDAFSAALKVYQDSNSPKMAEVSEKNLHRTQSQLRITKSGAGAVVEPDWAAEIEESTKDADKSDEKGEE